jgi:steroid delta-isomerase-like uncharacterized protein
MTTLELVQHYYACFNRKDWEGMLACLSDDVRHEINQGDPQTGIQLFRDFLHHMDECYDENLTDLVFMTEPSGTRCAAEFTVNGIYKKTDKDGPPARNQSYTLPAGAFLEVADGKITRVTTYYNVPLWIRLVWA